MRPASLVVLILAVTSCGWAEPPGTIPRTGTYNCINTPVIGNRKVQDALKLSRRAVVDVSQLHISFMRAKFDSDGEIGAIAAHEKKLLGMLSSAQLHRIAEISFQYQLVRTPVTFLSEDAQLAKELRLSNSQIQRLRKLNAKWIPYQRPAEQLPLIRSAFKVLSTSQRKFLGHLRGQPFKIESIDIGMTTELSRLKVLMKWADKNKDGVLAKAEVPELFPHKGDKNGDNRLDKREVQNELNALLADDLTYRKTLWQLTTR